MSLATVFSRANIGIEAPLVSIETHLSNGLPSLNIVGLPETAVRESKDRVRSAILNSHFEFPARRITISMAPADLPKAGGRYDLAIALGILAASQQIPIETLDHYEFIGELALSGELRGVNSCLPAAIAAASADRCLVVPRENADEAALAQSARIISASHLLELSAHLHNRTKLEQHETQRVASHEQQPDFADVRGQHQAKRALMIAAAGGHNLLFQGPPGSGKTMLAQRLPGILPAVSEAEALEIACIQSIANASRFPQSWGIRPFRQPHHTASAPALVGGGSNPRPGEITLAHRGVLFLDELPEFQRKVLEVLREPLESREITISRASRQVQYPAAFQLIAAMNPCPCGYYGTSDVSAHQQCRCTPDQIQRYRNKLSGPLLDRIDLHVNVDRVSATLLNTASESGEDSATIQQRVEHTQIRQRERCGKLNSQLNNQQIHQFCQLNPTNQQLLTHCADKLGLSARAYHRILKIARTIADWECVEEISEAQLLEAISYRNLDRNPTQQITT